MAGPLIPLYCAAMKIAFRTSVLLFLLAGLLATGWVLWSRQASTPPRSPQHTPAQDHTTAVPQAAAAGEALPAISPQLADAIRQHSKHSATELTPRTNADGSVSLEHGDHYQSVMVATRDADGNLVIRHGEDFLQHVNSRPAP